MAVEQQPTNQLRLFETGLSLYRQTLKRVRPVHRALHWLLSHTLIPLLERRQDFHTMPDDPFWFRIELLTQRHEPETTRTLHRLVQPGMTVLDIGAHVGYYTRLAARQVGAAGRVVAFEPHPRNHATLERNVGHYNNVTLMQVALAEGEGTAELHDYLMMSASGSLHYDEHLRTVQLSQVGESDVAPRISSDFQPVTYTVRTARVDALLDELGIERVDVVKMDIEGAELGALRGMRRTLERSDNLVMVMEYNPLGLQAFGHAPLTALQEVLAMGFRRVAAIEAGGGFTEYGDDLTGLEQRTLRLMDQMAVVNLLLTRGD